MSNNAPDYEDNLVFPPQMPLCDIEELKQKIKNLKELLKECRKALNKAKGDTVWYPVEIDHVLIQIDNAIGENNEKESKL